MTLTIALAGNPNCGKTTVFNALTGLRARVGNYAGVTVERKEGAMLGGPVAPPVMILDLPGTYSLSPQSLDEQIARDILFCRVPDVPKPDCVVVVVDASNLQRNLYYAMQVIELGYPTVLALNMVDVARDIGTEIDAAETHAGGRMPHLRDERIRMPGLQFHTDGGLVLAVPEERPADGGIRVVEHHPTVDDQFHRRDRLRP